MYQLKKIFLILCFCEIVLSKIHITADIESNKFLNHIMDVKQIKRKIEEVLPRDEKENIIVALKMWDAWAKMPSGIADGAFVALGDFDECYNIEYKEMFGKYCLGTLPFSSLPQEDYNAFGFNKTVIQQHSRLKTDLEYGKSEPYSNFNAMHFAICIPHTASVEDLSGLLIFSENFCYSKATKTDYSAGAIVMICVFSLFATVIVVSTAYDVFLYYTQDEPKHKLLIAFSFFTNGRKLITFSKNPDQLLCLNGIKAISMMWVVIGHEYNFLTTAPLSNVLQGLDWMKQPKNMFINGATVCVDSFFVVGGLVTVYIFIKSVDKGIKFNIGLYYIHRYLRLAPAYIMICLFHMFLLTYVSNGPLWSALNFFAVQSCLESWWTSLLFISNYVGNQMCLAQSWYLCVDMQLYILSPIVLLSLRKSKKLGIIVLSLLCILGCVVPGIVAHVDNFTSTQSPDYYLHYYYQTHGRFGTYVIGMVLGYVVYKYKKGDFRIELKPLAVAGLWILLLAGLFATVFAGFPLSQETSHDVWALPLYLAFNRQGWALCLSGVILLCVSNNGGPINWFLSLEIFQFLTRLSYSMYLVHATVIQVRLTSLRTPFQFSDLQLMHFFWGDFMLTLAISIVLSLSFEYPVAILESFLFKKNK